MRFRFGDYELDTERYELRCATEVVSLEPKAFRVLTYLVQQHGRAVAKGDLLAAFWPGAAADSYKEYALRNCLTKIRQALGEAGPQRAVIATVRGFGYRFVAPVTALAPAPDTASMSPKVSSTSDRAPTPAVRPPRLPEQRHLTILRCGLGPTAWLQRQDPETFQRLVQAFYQACEETIAPFAGYIAQYDSDEILIYFGYPVAYEDAALRAVRAGLALVAVVPRLELSGERVPTGTLAVRLSIHTGRVVVDALGDAGHGGPTVAGGMVSAAKQLHAQALPQTVLLSAETYRLVQDYVVCEAYETPHAPGDDAPLTLYRVLRESSAQSRFAVALARGLTPLVGRTAEVAVLQERWVQAQEGMGQVVLVSGEPGIGKSRLVQELKDQVASEAHTRLECHCSPYHTSSAWYPVIDLLQRVLGWQDLGTSADRLNVLEHFLRPLHSPLAETVPLLAALLSLSLPDGRYPPLTFSSQQQRQRTVALLQALVLDLAECQPVLLLVEDLHWVDPSTLECLSLLVEQVPTARCLLVLTARPEFSSPWGVRAHVTTLMVSRLRPSQVTVLAQQVAGAHRLSAAVCQQIVTQTDGVPLFVEELTKTVLESGVPRADQEAEAHAGPRSSVAIPPTLQDALMARLDRLATGKMVAQLGATIGRTFAYALLQAVSPLDEGILPQELTRLVGAELLYQRGIPPQATYTFKHALIQDAAYQSLLRSTRQQYHQRIAQVLETQFPEIVESQPELLAQHLTEAGLHAQAVSYWDKAGQRASQHSAFAEAIAHFRKGVEVLTTLPDTLERAQRELDLLIPLGAALGAAKGWAIPERGRVYNRARELCHRVGDTQRLIPVLNGLVSFHAISGRQRQAYELAEEMYALAQSLQNPVLLIRAQSMLGSNVFYHGSLELARTHLEQAIALHDAQQGHATLLHSSWGSNRGLYARGYLIWVLSVLGYLDQALQHSREALGLARDFARPYNLAHVLTFVMRAYQSRRELQATQECTQEIIALCTEYAFAYLLGCGIVLEGWARAMQGEAAQGIARMHQGLEAIRATETQGNLPYFLTLLAEAYARHAQARKGLAVVDDALRLVHNSGERCYEAELYRLKGVLRLTLSSDHHAEAEACFRQALDIARHQHAKALELRVAVSLSQLWQQHGKREAARAMLAPVYGWFTEGFDTADLQEAKALLDTLA